MTGLILKPNRQTQLAR